MSINYKDGYVTVSDFKANRPELAIHSVNAIQSAIYQACAMLNSHTDGKIKSVWDYTNNTENPETTNDLYRTETELEYISEAIIQQAQYIINMGNDLTVGSSSYALAGATYSDSTPTSREVIAPGVNQMLARARVYEYLVMGSSGSKSKVMYANGTSFDPDTTFLTYSAAYKIFVQQVQENANVGQVATIQTQNSTKQIVFTDPIDVDLNEYSTTQEMNLAISNAIAGLNLETYAKLIDLQALNGKVQQNTTNIANNNSRITALEQKYTNLDLSAYVTQAYVTSNYYSKQEANNLFARKDSITIPDLNGLVTDEELATQLANYVTSSNLTTQLNNYVPKSGGTVTGNLTITSNNIVKQSNGNNGVVTNTSAWNGKNYISTKYTTNVTSVSNNNTLLKIEANASSNSSVITGNNLTITGLVTPTADNQAATKAYVDSKVAAGGGSGGGGVAPDLSNYVTNDQLTTQLNNYVSNSNLTTQLANYVTTTNANNTYAPKTSPTFNINTGNPIKIKTPANNSGYIEFVRNNSNAGYVGLGSSANNHLMLGCRNGSVKLEPSNNQVDMSSARVINVATPTANTDATTKQYVDNAITNLSNRIPNTSSFVTSSSLNNTLTNYVTTSTLNNRLSSYATSSSVTQATSQAQTALQNANNALNQVTSKQDAIGTNVNNYVLYTQSFYNNVAIGSNYTAFFTVTCTLPNSNYKPINVSLWIQNSNSTTRRAFKIIQWRPVGNYVDIRIERSTSNATLGTNELYIRVVAANANLFNYWDNTDGSTTTPSPMSLAFASEEVEEENVIKLVPVEGTY